MSAVECVTCCSHHDLPLADGLRWARRHVCSGRPYPMRVSPAPPVADLQPTSIASPRRTWSWDDLHEDAEWLASTGCSPVLATQRLGITWDGLLAAYRRHNTPLPRVWKQDAA